MASFYQAGDSIEGLHTDGDAKKVVPQRPENRGGRQFYRCVLDRNAKLEITLAITGSVFLEDGAHRNLGDSVNGEKVRVLSEELLEYSAQPMHGTHRHQTRCVSTRSHTIASVAMRYSTVPDQPIPQGQSRALRYLAP